MRTVLVSEYLMQTPAEDVVTLLSDLIAAAVQQGDRDASVVLNALTAALSDPALVPYASRRTLYMAAKDAGVDEVARLFFDASPQLAIPAASGREDPMAPERPLTPKGRVLTLGERKSLARSNRREMLMHLLRDPHPAVIEVLLGNPHLTERDVVTLAARRPAQPESLAAIATSERWSARYEVKRALAKNPYTPVSLAMRLATTLRPGDLRAIAADENLAMPLREQARKLAGTR